MLRNIYQTLKDYYPDVYIGGSSAIKILSKFYQIDSEITPNDIDFFVTDPKLRGIPFESLQIFGETFKAIQSGNISSKTFQSETLSFDLTILKAKKLKTIEINGFKILHPRVILRYYEDENRNNQQKIQILNEIIKKIPISPVNTQKLSFHSAKKLSF